MIEADFALVAPTYESSGAKPADPTTCAASSAVAGPTAQAKWEARHALARHQSETERLRVLVDFLARPVHAPGGAEPDPDIVTAYNLAVEAALQGIRRATLATTD